MDVIPPSEAWKLQSSAEADDFARCCHIECFGIIMSKEWTADG